MEWIIGRLLLFSSHIRMVKYIVEHLEEELYEWSILEYA